jgi:hypothetical protein
MKKNRANLIAVIAFSILAVGLAHSAEQGPFSVTKDNRIEAHANNLALNEAVRSLANKFSLEVKGIGLGNEPINLDLSDITLEDLLKRLLRGYNYALVRPEKADKGILMILGKATSSAANSSDGCYSRRTTRNACRYCGAAGTRKASTSRTAHIYIAYRRTGSRRGWGGNCRNPDRRRSA